MPLHDWTRVDSGAFHDYHGSWIYAIHHALNGGLLPSGYYAMAEQVAGEIGPDVITLQESEPYSSNGPAMAVMEMAPPKARFMAETKATKPRLKPRRLTIRHVNRDRIVAVLEIVSRSNKSGAKAIRHFTRKIVDAVAEGIHAAVIDVFPPTTRDPNGLHGLIWKSLGGKPFTIPHDQPLLVSSYEAGNPRRCYVEPLAPGLTIPNMPLFLRAGHYVSLPLEETYQTAWRYMPARYKTLLTSPS